MAASSNRDAVQRADTIVLPLWLGAKKTVIEGEARAEAARIRGAAYALDREFGLFLEKLQAFQAMVADTRDVLLLSTKHPLFDLLRGPPTPKP